MYLGLDVLKFGSHLDVSCTHSRVWEGESHGDALIMAHLLAKSRPARLESKKLDLI